MVLDKDVKPYKKKKKEVQIKLELDLAFDFVSH